MSLLETVFNAFLDKKLAQTPNTTHTQNQIAGRSIAKGLVAGLVAGVVATAAKSAVEKMYPPRVEGQPEPPEVLAEKAAGHELTVPQKLFASEAIHWTFGATIGAAYGTIAEFYPAATAREGVNFGMTLMALTHETALPAMGLSAAPADQTRREKTSEFASHIVFGLVAETTRRIVRKML